VLFVTLGFDVWMQAKLLGDGPFFTGDDVTVADLKIYETFRKLKIIEAQPSVATSTLAGFAALVAFVDRIEAIPAMKRYVTPSQSHGVTVSRCHSVTSSPQLWRSGHAKFLALTCTI
jgi:hypothetical protein